MKKNRKTRLFFAMALVSSLMAKTSESQAWTGLEDPPLPSWGTIPARYYLNKATFPPNLGIKAEEHVKKGFSSWSAPNCTYFDTQLVGDLPDGTYDINDGKNVLFWVNKPDSWPPELGPEDGVIGVTLPVWKNDGMGHLVLIDADIIFNNVGFCWFDYDPANPGMKCSGGKPVDALSIITHEQGHFLGLGHTTVAGATMEPAYLGGNSLATIEKDDIDGVCALYPLGGFSISAAEGSSCDVCRQKVAKNACLPLAKACTSSCLRLGDCIAQCPRNDVEAYEACSAQCSTQFHEGLEAYTAYTNCWCGVCTDVCASLCGGPMESGAGVGPCANNFGGAGGATPNECGASTATGTGSCGCALVGDAPSEGLVVTLGILLVGRSRRRRRA